MTDFLRELETSMRGGPYCWHCQLEVRASDPIIIGVPIFFCSPACEQEWIAKQRHEQQR